MILSLSNTILLCASCIKCMGHLLSKGWTQVFSNEGHRSSARKDTGLQQDKYNVLEGNLQASSAPEDMRTSSASRERSSAAEGLRDLRIFPKMKKEVRRFSGSSEPAPGRADSSLDRAEASGLRILGDRL
ncbi:hypothetical protein L6452_31830 [Arctium lappa]|uniref:Uncharacterized protein n=1 Tax=Arctium lappa TaxID=4217 RepID=A0ACB8Z225_ARCLA|nr:hypothetical protein L6452_31830 [Arctium lappa]